jgi:hypothetical protein
MFRESRPIAEKYSHLKFPDGLTAEDQKSIIAQCEYQGDTSDEDILGFAAAYADAKSLTEGDLRLSPKNVHELILRWARLTEPRNIKGVRTTPITFANGNSALAPNLIDQALQNFEQEYAMLLEDKTEDERYNRDKLFFNFENIHPFEDGNGRVGDLLWKVLSYAIDKKWPYGLPPEYK